MTLRKPVRILFRGAMTAVLGLVAISCADEEDEGDEDNGGSSTAATGNRPTGGVGNTGATNTGGSGNSASLGGNSNLGGTGNRSTVGGRGDVEPCDGLPYDPESGPDGTDDRGICTGVAFEVEGSPVDMFILMDRTISQSYFVEGTSISRWEAMLSAVEQFSRSDEAASVNAGIVFQNKYGTGNEDRECNPADYATPVVEMQPMPQAGPLIIEAMQNLQPNGMTPLVPAVQGAMDYAKQWQAANPDRITVLILVGDGYPTICEETSPSAVADLIASGWTTDPPVRTYAIGVGASSELNLDNYARAGGTNEAVMTDESGVTEGFLSALLNITNSFVPCEYSVPPPPSDLEEVDFSEVTIVYTPFVGEPMEIPAAGSPMNCSTGGWYYDNPSNPTQVIMCPCSCSRLGAGRVEAMFDCKPLPPIL
ncbi:MAG: VWA domain-containing protein [Polyangiaceae bacterium]|nr:VWA domain-containing protein [Polyangiaceae bacterium]